MAIIVNLLGIFIIVFIAWWFWFCKLPVVKVESSIIDILVKDGNYLPARIEASANQPITLQFTRKDSSPCSEYLLIEQLNIHEQLPLGQPFNIELGKLSAGTYRFTCQMNMYVGELVVT